MISGRSTVSIGGVGIHVENDVAGVCRRRRPIELEGNAAPDARTRSGCSVFDELHQCIRRARFQVSVVADNLSKTIGRGKVACLAAGLVALQPG